MVFFWTPLGIILIWQKFSGTWESDFNRVQSTDNQCWLNKHEPRLRESDVIKLKYTLKQHILNVNNITSDGCFWTNMSPTKMYDLTKVEKNSVAKWPHYPWSKVCTFLRRYGWYSIYSMYVSHHFAHLLIVSHQILIYHSSIYKHSILI